MGVGCFTLASGWSRALYPTKRAHHVGTVLFSCSQTFQTEICRNLLLIDWDGGCVADTSRWRINCAYKAAALVWPELELAIQAASTSIATATVDRRTSWLTNKMEAISRVLDEDTRVFSAAAQHVLAVRLLVEEQQLDQGQSLGTGKYGSLYHPRQAEDTVCASDEDGSINGSRPLTVNEIILNWCDLLLETLPIKYRVRPPDLEVAIERVSSKTRDVTDFPRVNTGTMSMLVSMATRQALVESLPTLPIITVRHVGDIPVVIDLLSNHLKDAGAIRIEVVKNLDSILTADTWGTIYVVHKTKSTIPELIGKGGSSNGKKQRVSKIHVVESSWVALQADTAHIGHPVLADDSEVSLQLLAWSPTPEMERRATMCPWSRPCTSTTDLEAKLGVQLAGFE